MPTQVLTLRVDPGESEHGPVLTILVAGRDLVAGSQRDRFQGFDPGDMLGPGSPLLPLDPPRRVAVYRCNCGEPGCGCVAPVIAREDTAVVWREARDYTGVYAGPTTDEDPAAGGRSVGLPDLRFDAEQYEAEVRRARADRTWETDPRATARLLRRRLLGRSEQLGALGYTLDWVVPSGDAADTFEVSLRDRSGDQRLVEVAAPPGRPEERADELADRIVAEVGAGG